jgi:hypothetical protein
METIELRLARLERENRRLKSVGLVLIVALASLFLMGQVRPAREITAEKFTLVDGAGSTIAVLGRVEVGPAPGMPALWMHRPGVTSADVTLSVLHENLGGGALLALGQPDSTVPARLIARSYVDGRPSFVQGHNAAGQPIWSLP